MKDWNKKVNGIPIQENTLKYHTNLEKQRGGISKFKNIFISSLFVIPIFLYILDNIYIPYKSLIIFLISYVVYVYISLRLRYMVYFLVTKKTRKLKLKDIMKVYKYLITPDYFYAKFFKDIMINKQMEKQSNSDEYDHYLVDKKNGLTLYSWDLLKVQHKYYLIYSNWMNVIVSSLFILFILLFGGKEGSILSEIVVFLFIIRTVSRSFEITYAFYKDITNVEDKVFKDESIEKKELIYIHNWKNSYLLRGNRLSLAFHSLLEVTLLYGGMYLIIGQFNISTGNSLFQSFINSIAVSVMTEAPSDGIEPANWVLSITQLAHVILTLTLIVLSIASYLGDKNELIKREKQLYLYLRKNEND